MWRRLSPIYLHICEVMARVSGRRTSMFINGTRTCYLSAFGDSRRHLLDQDQTLRLFAGTHVANEHSCSSPNSSLSAMSRSEDAERRWTGQKSCVSIPRNDESCTSAASPSPRRMPECRASVAQQLNFRHRAESAAVRAHRRHLVRQPTGRSPATSASQRSRPHPAKRDHASFYELWCLLASGVPPRDVASNLGVSVPTLYRWIPASNHP